MRKGTQTVEGLATGKEKVKQVVEEMMNINYDFRTSHCNRAAAYSESNHPTQEF